MSDTLSAQQVLTNLLQTGFKTDLLAEAELLKILESALARNANLRFGQLRALVCWAMEAVQNYNALNHLLAGKCAPVWYGSADAHFNLEEPQ